MSLEGLFRNRDGQATTGVLFFGDNLDVLRKYLIDESVDLIYLDPPFNSKASYNILFREPAGAPSAAQIRAFEDTWHWGDESEEAFRELVQDGPEKVSNLLNSLVSSLGRNDVTAYLVMMGIRILELHRVLKRTGSLYLHCDPTMSHYIKLVLDSVFGPKCFRNEIIWHYRRWTAASKRFQRMHDVILFYTKTDQFYFKPPLVEPTDTQRRVIERGWNVNVVVSGGQRIRQLLVYNREKYNRALEENRINPENYDRIHFVEGGGTIASDVWTDIQFLHSQAKERLSYPTQKPEKLLERIVESSSHPDDIVLDPFCGCGTTVSVAQKLGRRWIGIDITHLAITLIKARLKDQFGIEPGQDYNVHGDPVDLEGAKALAMESRYEFEYWALSLLPPARPTKSQETDRRGTGPDTGYDGMIYLADGDPRKPVYKRILIQVKSGRIGVKEIRELISVVERENDAVAGILITLQEPTRNMLTEALSAGEFQHEATGRSYPRIQVAFVEGLLKGKRPRLPENWLVMSTRSAPRVGSGRNRSLL